MQPPRDKMNARHLSLETLQAPWVLSPLHTSSDSSYSKWQRELSSSFLHQPVVLRKGQV